MEVDDDSYIVDLSITSNNRGAGSPVECVVPQATAKRTLRPRVEAKNYADVDADECQQNGYVNGFDYSDSDDGGELPPLPPVKEYTESERLEAEREIKRLKDELRNEEMKLVLLKKLRQSQQMKEITALNTAQQTPVGKCSPNRTMPGKASPTGQLTQIHRGQLIPPSNRIDGHLTSPSSPIVNNHPNNRSIAPGMPPNMYPVNSHQIHKGTSSGTSSSHTSIKSNINASNNSTRNVTLANSISNSNLSYQSSNTLQDRLKDGSQTTAPPNNVPFSLSVTPQQHSMMDSKMCTSIQQPRPEQPERRTEDTQTPAQRQAAAKLALKKQLEKTLLQIPPPKPPPPEMNFIPNPSNTEFVYLLGLEHVVDYITKDHKTPPPPEPFQCSQCNTNFTPVWKWEKISKGKESKVICEVCVTSNVKKALKAEHTNRLKTAFVKALQQEKEIEQRLAQSASPQPPDTPTQDLPQRVGSRDSDTPPITTTTASTTVLNSAPSPVPPPPSTTPKLNSSRHHTSTPPQQPPPQPSPPAKTSADTKFSPHHAAAAALHQQLLRAGLPAHQPLPAHMMPFLYPYQLAMAQATGGKNPVAAAVNLVELQRQAADLQRQYLMDMIPAAAAAAASSSGNSNATSSRNSHSSVNNWKS